MATVDTKKLIGARIQSLRIEHTGESPKALRKKLTFEAQQQNLRVNLGGIYLAIRALLHGQIGKLGAKYAAS
jgi:hypothetical protein